MKFSVFGISITIERKAPAKRRKPTQPQPQPAAARLKRPEQSCFRSISSDQLGVPTNQPPQLPGKTTPWYQPQPSNIVRIY